MDANKLNFNFDNLENDPEPVKPTVRSKSSLRMNSKGKRYLEVFYNKDKDDYEDAIREAKIGHGLENKPILIICMPMSD